MVLKEWGIGHCGSGGGVVVRGERMLAHGNVSDINSCIFLCSLER